MSAQTLFKALGDPLRYTMVERLCAESPMTVGRVIEGLEVTRQGARRQLQVLVDAGLVVLEPMGREVYASLEPEALSAMHRMVEELTRRWDQRLDALRRHVEGE